MKDAQREAYMTALESNHEALTGEFYKGFGHDSASAETGAQDRRGRFFQAAPVPQSSPAGKKQKKCAGGGGGDGDNDGDGGNDDEEQTKKDKRRSALVDPNRCAKVYSGFEPLLQALDQQIEKANTEFASASTTCQAHGTDRVFTKLREGLTIRHKIFCFLTKSLDSEECVGYSRKPNKDVPWTLEQELESITESELRFVPISVREMIHRNCLPAKLDSVFEAQTNGELQDKRKEASESLNAVKKIVLTLEKQCKEVADAVRSKAQREQSAKDKEKKAAIQAETKLTQQQQKQAEDRAKVLQEQRQAAHRAQAKQPPSVKLSSVCVCGCGDLRIWLEPPEVCRR